MLSDRNLNTKSQNQASVKRGKIKDKEYFGVEHGSSFGIFRSAERLSFQQYE